MPYTNPGRPPAAAAGGAQDGEPVRLAAWSDLPAPEASSLVAPRATSTSLDTVTVTETISPARTVRLDFGARTGGYTGTATVTGSIDGVAQVEAVTCPSGNAGAVLETVKAFDDVATVALTAQPGTDGEWSAGWGNGVALPDEAHEDATGAGVLLSLQYGDPPTAVAAGFGAGRIVGPTLSPPNGVFVGTDDVPLGATTGTGPENNRLAITYLGVSA